MRTTLVNSTVHPASFRDPGGFVFTHDGALYRQINARCRNDYDRLMDSGLYEKLVGDGLLVSHEEASLDLRQSDDAYKIIKPEPVPFISHPYEWCFSQLKQAALLTLRIQRLALARGLSLKDASAYNVQFRGCAPVFIDTLSFEPYVEGRPWVAYRQFCQHFLAPLALMSRVDIRLGQLLRSNIDGVPLDLTSALLPGRTKLSFSLLTHIHLHAKSQSRYADKPVKQSSVSMSKLSLTGVLDSLRKAVESLAWTPGGTAWADYYDHTNYVPEALRRKAELVEAYFDRTGAQTVWDVGANTGVFSRIAARKGAFTVAFDFDPAAVEKNFLDGSKAGERGLLPLVLDATNPSPGIGWENRERASLADRGPVDAVFALALVHHLAIGANVPLDRIARFFARLGAWLVIEFVPKGDSQVERLLASREDIFDRYTREGFESAFSEYFSIDVATDIENTNRTLYLMRTRD